MREAVSYWLWEYERRGFVRWGIFNHKEEEVIGTVELFHRDSEDYFKDCGLRVWICEVITKKQM